MPARLRSSHRPAVVLIVTCLSLGATVSLVTGRPAQSNSTPSTALAFDVMEKSIDDLQRAMQDKQVTSRQLVDIYLARIEAYDKRGPSLNAIMAVNPRAREAADALDDERASRGARGPLHGIPVLVKDNYETIEMPTTAGSIALAAFHPARDAVLVQRLKAAGAVILGKTNDARARGGHRDGGLRVRTDEESVRSRSQPRRIERRHGCRGRGELRGRRHGQRYVRIDSQSCRRTTTSSACAGRRACPAARASCRCRARRTSADRSRAASTISPSCSTPPSAPDPADPPDGGQRRARYRDRIARG